MPAQGNFKDVTSTIIELKFILRTFLHKFAFGIPEFRSIHFELRFLGDLKVVNINFNGHEILQMMFINQSLEIVSD